MNANNSLTPRLALCARLRRRGGYALRRGHGPRLPAHKPASRAAPYPAPSPPTSARARSRARAATPPKPGWRTGCASSSPTASASPARRTAARSSAPGMGGETIAGILERAPLDEGRDAAYTPAAEQARRALRVAARKRIRPRHGRARRGGGEALRGHAGSRGL